MFYVALICWSLRMRFGHAAFCLSSFGLGQRRYVILYPKEPRLRGG